MGLGITTRPARPRGQVKDGEPSGLGLGFFIAKTLLERSGATVAATVGLVALAGPLVVALLPGLDFAYTRYTASAFIPLVAVAINHLAGLDTAPPAAGERTPAA